MTIQVTPIAIKSSKTTPVKAHFHFLPVCSVLADFPDVSATAAAVAARPDSLTQSLLGWVVGCAFVYAALFGAGSFIYGKTAQGIVWAVVFAVSGIGLIRLLPRLWAGAREPAV